ncbi:hypothetical protein V6N13_114295 [Hibiscus sabdariffa]|uniref:Uncharacterized protein n=1 Tax=Hibiscus sabdariffa TaxID=183260 RepID=A0ABR2U1E3_9ROSI
MTKTPANATLLQGSRFNPIFIEDIDTSNFVNQATPNSKTRNANKEASPTPNIRKIQLTTTETQAHKEKIVKPKVNGNAHLLIIKPPTYVLAPKNLNIIP